MITKSINTFNYLKYREMKSRGTTVTHNKPESTMLVIKQHYNCRSWCLLFKVSSPTHLLIWTYLAGNYEHISVVPVIKEKLKFRYSKSITINWKLLCWYKRTEMGIFLNSQKDLKTGLLAPFPCLHNTHITESLLVSVSVKAKLVYCFEACTLCTKK